MYFIFPDNLPASVQKAAFEFTSGQFPLYRYITPDTEILNRGISIAIPDEASHIRSIRLTTSLSHFTYYYPEKGYKIAQGGYYISDRWFTVIRCTADLNQWNR